MIGLEIADMAPQGMKISRKRLEKFGTFIEPDGRAAKPHAKKLGSEKEIRCIEIKIGGNTRQVMRRRPRFAVDVSIELLPIDINCTAYMRNGTLRGTCNLQVFDQVRHR
ncbi:hypothetical protein RRH01S_05_04210 [Rhizobium rhizogenes NBRC 13257]|uniref:Uncharacterized protein n=1 Tax=Rhizobium rhizogenes NBRC 13257 TaxID=1220581 RepID=A0AA87Q0S8_RHIRH|nr:hypothetical protein RRH01S_05_04210 [Rhizobium rhizogenes NBRC 13257]